MTTVLSVASEVFPLVKTGGLADVAGALPRALQSFGVSTRTLMPAYPAVRAALADAAPVLDIADLFGGPARIRSAAQDGLDLLLLDAPHLFERPGGPYAGADGSDHPDNWARFAALGKAGALLGQGAVEGFRPDILHAHDWQAALAPVYLSYSNAPRPRTVITIHNLAFQGSFPHEVFPELGLPDSAWSIDGVEYYGGVSFLKGGLQTADAITTVSPTYAEEILTPAGGMGLDGLLRARAGRLHGILNGIDAEHWNPASDAAIARTYSAARFSARKANKRALEQAFGLEPGEGPVFGVVSRLTWQKGMDLVAGVLDALVEQGARFALVGSGEAPLEGAFLAARSRHPGSVGVVIGYDEALSHKVQAGADAILVPSRFEPCGLTQLYGLRYGCVPVVARVGGLADTVVDANFAAVTAGVATGVMFAPGEPAALLSAIERTLRLYRDRPVWEKMQKQGMRSEVGWSLSAARYAGLYRELMEERSA